MTAPITPGTASGDIVQAERFLTQQDPEVSFTVLTNVDGLLTKSIRPDGNGGIVKDPVAHLTQGTAERVTIRFSTLGLFIRGLAKNQAIAHGITEYDKVDIVSASRYTGQPRTVTRSKEYFSYPAGWGLGMFDHDPKPGQRVLTPEEFREIIGNIWPIFSKFPTVTTSSTSACISDMAGNQLTGPGDGWHMYFPFLPAGNLPKSATWLFKKCWLTGHGYIYLSKSGSLLPRTIFDASVFSPERLDFVAGAHCIDCYQDLAEPIYMPGNEEVRC